MNVLLFYSILYIMNKEEKDTLLTREEFRKKVLLKYNGKCCVPGCNCDAVDAHHIMDRKLWNDGGYYLSNGAALCSKHHLDAETGKITPKQCLDYMGINLKDIRVPDKIAEKYSKKISNFKDLYLTFMLDALINKWGE